MYCSGIFLDDSLYPFQQRPICNHHSFIPQGGLSAQAFVRVDLEDVNDNHPVFNPSTYMSSISGQTQPGTEITRVLATDRDSGVHGTVAYEFVPGHLSSLFTIDSTTGMRWAVVFILCLTEKQVIPFHWKA